MRPIVVTVGPLATATATKVSLAQRPRGASSALALNGAAGDAVATTVCASQSPGAAALTINGTYTSGGVAYLPGLTGQYVYITSGGDDHLITFAVKGVTGNARIAVTETLTGTNGSVVATHNQYTQILSITPSGAVASTVTVGSFTQATLDTPRRVLFTTGADESANTVVITGTTWGGSPATETLALTNTSTSYTVLDYLTVTSAIVTNAAAGNISVGTNGVASSAWVFTDPYAAGALNAQFTVSGTANYTIQASNDDPNSFSNPVTPANMTWLTDLTGVVGATQSSQLSISSAPLVMNILLNSETGSASVTGTFVQQGAVTY